MQQEIHNKHLVIWLHDFVTVVRKTLITVRNLYSARLLHSLVFVKPIKPWLDMLSFFSFRTQVATITGRYVRVKHLKIRFYVIV